MQPKFTPGPWRVRETPESSHQDFTVETEGNASIAAIFYQRGGSDVANARLIAAAPDLLRELKRGGTHSRACAIKGVGSYPAGWIDGEAKQCTCSLGEVIAKAEGRDGAA